MGIRLNQTKEKKKNKILFFENELKLMQLCESKLKTQLQEYSEKDKYYQSNLET